jgi:hypothetical protein
VKIEFVGLSPLPDDELMKNVRHARGLGYPQIQEVQEHGRRLAVVGGGPSIVDRLDEIREFTDIWAINGACRFLREHGIDSTLLTIDPVDFLAPRVSGASKALLGTRCHPDTFRVLEGADIRVFDVNTDSEDGLWASCSTVTVAFPLAVKLGYRKLVFFGCEGSYSERTHAYMDEAELQDYRFDVVCGGKRFTTAPDLYLLTQQMAALIRMSVHDSFTERSGGLLSALIADPEHDIVEVSPLLQQSLKPVCPSCGYAVGHYDDCEVGLGVFPEEA